GNLLQSLRQYPGKHAQGGGQGHSNHSAGANRVVRRCARDGIAGEGLVVCEALTHGRKPTIVGRRRAIVCKRAPCPLANPSSGREYQAPGGRATVESSIACSSRSTPVPSESRCRMSFSRPSGSSEAKPCTSDHARAIAAAWSSESASSASPASFSLRPAPTALANPSKEAVAASC